ncbi:MAG: hypothetical protein JWL83_1433 [Actinomycetia bacterium]|nr:hypothetical protein [Actinomycetes bacterium]
MLASDVYRPDQWHDFFIMVGGAAAALTGLVFVALSLDLATIIRDATHRARAVGTLTSLAAIFVMSALALMGDQGHIEVGVEWLVVATLAGVVCTDGYVQARRAGNMTVRDSLRAAAGTALYVALLAGAVVLIAGSEIGLTITAVALVALGAFSVFGAWLLLAGVHPDQARDSN